jgi:hypothetical protein
MYGMGGVDVLAATWLAILTLVVLEFAGVTRRGTSWRWGGIGVLLVVSAGVADTFAQYRGWSFSRIDSVNSITIPVAVAGFILLSVGTVMRAREQRKRGQAESRGK